MGERPESQIAAELTAELTELGLTEYEARTLSALVRLGSGTAKDVANADDVPRSRVYDAVETLHERGLVDIQYATPQRYSVISRESVVQKLDTERRNRVSRIADLMSGLDETEPRHEQFGTWTVSGQDTVRQRVLSFLEAAEDRVIYLTVDGLLTDEHLAALADAADRGVDVFVGGVSDQVWERVSEAVPSVQAFETLWEWQDTPAGSLLIADEQVALVSVRLDDADTGEVAIWGEGDRNTLVVILRAIFTWQLEAETDPDDE